VKDGVEIEVHRAILTSHCHHASKSPRAGKGTRGGVYGDRVDRADPTGQEPDPLFMLSGVDSCSLHYAQSCGRGDRSTSVCRDVTVHVKRDACGRRGERGKRGTAGGKPSTRKCRILTPTRVPHPRLIAVCFPIAEFPPLCLAVRLALPPMLARCHHLEGSRGVGIDTIRQV
jgi:hypothetical protein